MLPWIKGIVIIIGLIITGIVHFSLHNKPQEEIIDNAIEYIVEDVTRFDVDMDLIEECMEIIEDKLEK